MNSMSIGPRLSNDIERSLPIGFISSPYLGWRTIKGRFINAFTSEGFTNIQHSSFTDYYPRLKAWTSETGKLYDIWQNLAIRKAARSLVSQGVKNIIVTTTSICAFLPISKSVHYTTYGDATVRQIYKLYHKRAPEKRQLLLEKSLRRLKSSTTFLCMSNWYLDELSNVLGLSDDNAKVLLPPVDLSMWMPGSPRSTTNELNILFIGGDFKRKGGDSVLSLAQDPRFRTCKFHIVTKAALPDIPNVIGYDRMLPDSAELIRLVQNCDIYLQPTFADCSSIAAAEAACCGLPSVVSSVGGIPEVVINNVTGFVVDPDSLGEISSSLQELADDFELRRNMGRFAKERAESAFDSRNILRLLDII